MKVEEAIAKARESFKNSSLYDFSRNLNPTKLALFFKKAFEEEFEFTPVIVLPKNFTNKMRGFLKLFRNNGYSNKEILDFVKEVISNWYMLRGKKIETVNGKTWRLGKYPKLEDIVYCNRSLLQLLEDIKAQENARAKKPAKLNSKEILKKWLGE